MGSNSPDLSSNESFSLLILIYRDESIDVTSNFLIMEYWEKVKVIKIEVLIVIFF